MSNSSTSARAIDHVVLPVGTLELARKRLESLGFTVAPEGIHPFGTANACVYFADGTFLEPLVIADAKLAEREADNGNVFVARDRSYRHLAGENGFSALVMATDDAAADHETFVKNELSAGKMLDFSRSYTDAAGHSATVSFKLAFAAHPLAPEAFFFTCQRIDAPQSGRGALAEHANGVSAIQGIVAIADDPPAFHPLLSAVTATSGKPDGRTGLSFASGDAEVTIVTPDRFSESIDTEPPHGPGLRLAAIRFKAESRKHLSALLTSNGIAFREAPAGLVVAPAAGQGAHFIFEAATA